MRSVIWTTIDTDKMRRCSSDVFAVTLGKDYYGEIKKGDRVIGYEYDTPIAGGMAVCLLGGTIVIFFKGFVL